MRWFFPLSLVGCLALSFNACNRQKPEVLLALPGVNHHHGDEHHEEGEHAVGGHGEEHGEPEGHGEEAHGAEHAEPDVHVAEPHGEPIESAHEAADAPKPLEHH